MKQIVINEFEKIASQDINNMQKVMHQGLYDKFLYQFLEAKSGFVRDSFAPSYVSATGISINEGIALYYDSTATGFDAKYQPILLSVDLALTLGSGSWAAAPTLGSNRWDIVVIRPKQEVTSTSVRKVKVGGTGPIADQTVDKVEEFTYEIDIVEGTADVSPTIPSTPAGWMKVAEVYITGGTGIATAADVKDARTLLYGPALVSSDTYEPDSYPYTLTKANDGHTLLIDTTTSKTLILPAPTPGFKTTFKDMNGHASTFPFTLQGDGTAKIEGLTSNYQCAANNGSWTITTDGTDWFLV